MRPDTQAALSITMKRMTATSTLSPTAKATTLAPSNSTTSGPGVLPAARPRREGSGL
jgi:hypothetical protein